MNFLAVFSYVVETHRDDQTEHSEVHTEKTQGNEHKVQDGKSPLHITYFLTVVQHWNRFSRETTESPFLESFKTQLDTTLSKLT